MDPTRSDDRPARRHPALAALRSLLLIELPPHGTRPIDIVVLFIGIPIALVVCLPILVVTVIAALPLGFLLDEVGAPEVIRAAYGLGAFGVGLMLCFLVLRRLYRRVPPLVRRLISEPEVETEPRTPVLGPDPDADPETFHDRVTAADAALADRRGNEPEDRDLGA
jgi:hypothetical protein